MRILSIVAAIVIVLFYSNNAIAQNPIKVNATYNGLNELSEYVFISEQGDELIAQEIDSDITIILDDDAIGNKYEITYTEETVDEVDDEGYETGNKYKVIKITSIKEL